MSNQNELLLFECESYCSVDESVGCELVVEAARLVFELLAERLEAPELLESGRCERAADERRTRHARRVVRRRAGATRADVQELRVLPRLVVEARPAHLVPVFLRRARSLDLREPRHLQQVRLLEAQTLQTQAREFQLVRRLHAHFSAARCTKQIASKKCHFCIILYNVKTGINKNSICN